MAVDKAHKPSQLNADTGSGMDVGLVVFEDGVV